MDILRSLKLFGLVITFCDTATKKENDNKNFAHAFPVEPSALPGIPTIAPILMISHLRSQKLIYILGLSLLISSPCLLAQNEGIGTFSDLVNEALQTSTEPQPSPVVKTTLQRSLSGETKSVTETTAPPLFSGWSVGAEYDYRRTQQKFPGGLTIDINEAHSSFSFLLASTKIAFDFVHLWSEGRNDLGDKQSISADGIKMTLTQPMGDHVVFSLPIFYRNDDANIMVTTGHQTFDVDNFVMNPFVVFAWKLPVLKDATGQPLSSKKQPLGFSFSPGYRLGVTQRNDIQPIAADVDGWTGHFNTLIGLDYAPKNHDGINRWAVSGTATWSHLARHYSSKAGGRPDDNSFALGASVTHVLLLFEETNQPRLTGKISYQYDGFNNDFYQHSVAVVGTYRF